MPINAAEFGATLPVDGYGPGFFRVGGVVHHGGIVIHAEAVSRWAGYDDIPPLAALAGQVDILFIGTGPQIVFLPKPFVAGLEALGLMCEPMSTPSAARTYNVLLSEGRRVAAALLPMPAAA